MLDDIILVIPDLHIPFHHPDAFNFLDAVSSKYFRDIRPDKRQVICLGDEIDNHSISFHDKDPDMPFSASKELEKAIWYLQDLYILFPNVTVLESNHSSLIYRKQKFHGLPKALFKDYNEILHAPKGWSWHFDYITQSGGKDIYFHHGLNKRADIVSKNKSMNIVQGHHHSEFCIIYWSNSVEKYFGISSGCLVDINSLAFAYALNNLPKPLLGCPVIRSGVPSLIPMDLNKKGRWTGKIV